MSRGMDDDDACSNPAPTGQTPKTAHAWCLACANIVLHYRLVKSQHLQNAKNHLKCHGPNFGMELALLHFP